jgi:hypothetical protein
MYETLGGGVVGLYIFMYSALMAIAENEKMKINYLAFLMCVLLV